MCCEDALASWSISAAVAESALRHVRFLPPPLRGSSSDRPLRSLVILQRCSSLGSCTGGRAFMKSTVTRPRTCSANLPEFCRPRCSRALRCSSAPGFDPARLSKIGSALVGAALGFTASPCGLGAVALAGALRVRAPVAAVAFLCVAGIIDLRALQRASHGWAGHDTFAYALLAAALGIVAWRHGDSLVHPAFTAALGCCACGALLCAVRHPRSRSPGARAAPLLMLFGALVGAPAPQYHATETTLENLFAGEHLTFTGVLARDAGTSSVVRYAITCCRADAAPVAVQLERSVPYPAGTWLRVDGRIESDHGNLRLVPQTTDRVAAPTDPFIYR